MGVSGVQSTSTDEVLKLSMMEQTLKQSLGDGMEFELVYQSLLNAEKETASASTKSVIDGLTNTNIQNIISKSSTATSGQDTDSSSLLSGVSDDNSSLAAALGIGNDSSFVSEGTDLGDLPMQINSSLGYLNSSAYSASKSLNVSTQSSSETMKKIYDSVNKYAKQYGVDPNLVLAVIKNESDFKTNDVSSTGAVGLMQLMPGTARDLGVTNSYDIDENIKGGVKLLKEDLDKYNGDVRMAYMAYGAGSGTMQKRGVTSASDIYKMPEETQISVPRFMKYYQEFSQQNN